MSKRFLLVAATLATAAAFCVGCGSAPDASPSTNGTAEKNVVLHLIVTDANGTPARGCLIEWAENNQDVARTTDSQGVYDGASAVADTTQHFTIASCNGVSVTLVSVTVNVTDDGSASQDVPIQLKDVVTSASDSNSGNEEK